MTNPLTPKDDELFPEDRKILHIRKDGSGKIDLTEEETEVMRLYQRNRQAVANAVNYAFTMAHAAQDTLRITQIQQMGAEYNAYVAESDKTIRTFAKEFSILNAYLLHDQTVDPDTARKHSVHVCTEQLARYLQHLVGESAYFQEYVANCAPELSKSEEGRELVEECAEVDALLSAKLDAVVERRNEFSVSEPEGEYELLALDAYRYIMHASAMKSKSMTGTASRDPGLRANAAASRVMAQQLSIQMQDELDPGPYELNDVLSHWDNATEALLQMVTQVRDGIEGNPQFNPENRETQLLLGRINRVIETIETYHAQLEANPGNPHVILDSAQGATDILKQLQQGRLSMSGPGAEMIRKGLSTYISNISRIAPQLAEQIQAEGFVAKTAPKLKGLSGSLGRS
jgi:hypothetical protein